MQHIDNVPGVTCKFRKFAQREEEKETSALFTVGKKVQKWKLTKNSLAFFFFQTSKSLKPFESILQQRRSLKKRSSWKVKCDIEIEIDLVYSWRNGSSNLISFSPSSIQSLRKESGCSSNNLGGKQRQASVLSSIHHINAFMTRSRMKKCLLLLPVESGDNVVEGDGCWEFDDALNLTRRRRRKEKANKTGRK